MPVIIFIGPISEARQLVCYAVLVVAGRAGHITVRLVLVGVAHAVVTLKGLRRRKADGTKQECRNQRGGKTTNHVNLLIVGISPRSCRVEAKMRHERRYFQYRLVLGMIWRTDRSADREEIRRARGRRA
jgi:hypothetical protein